MINRNDFKEQMERLMEVFSPLTPGAIEEYYLKFRHFDLPEIEDAVGMLIIDHKGDFTPKPAELLGMINELRKQSPDSLPGEQPPAPLCEVCEGTGFKTWLVEGKLKATPCIKCHTGQRIVNAPVPKHKRLDYPDGWRELYNLNSWRQTAIKQIPQTTRSDFD